MTSDHDTITRCGLAFLPNMSGGFKFAACEAEGIRPLGEALDTAHRQTIT